MEGGWGARADVDLACHLSDEAKVVADEHDGAVIFVDRVCQRVDCLEV